MKHSERIPGVIGLILLFLSAIFLVALMIQILNINTEGSILQIFSSLGRILFDTYNFSSLLIPVFFFVAGICCFSSTWSNKKGVILCISVVPFFTIVEAEKLYHTLNATESGPLYIIKLVALIVILIMILVVEYTIAFILGDKVEKWCRKKSIWYSEEDEKSDNSWYSSEVLTLDNEEKATIEQNIEAEKITSQEDTETQVELENTAETNQPFSKEMTIEELEQRNNSEKDFWSNVEQDNYDETEELPQSSAEAAFLADPFDEGLQEEQYGSLDYETEDDVTEQIAFNNTNKNSLLKSVENLANNFKELKEEESTLEETQETELYEKDNPCELQESQEEIPFESDYSSTDSFEIKKEDFPEGYSTLMNNTQEEVDEEVEDEEEDSEEDEYIQPDFPAKEIDTSEDKTQVFLDFNSSLDDEDEDIDYSFDFFDTEDKDDLESQDKMDEDIIDSEEDFETEALDEPIENNFNTEKKINETVSPTVPAKKRHQAYKIPSEGLLTNYPDGEYWVIDRETEKAALELKETLSEFKIEAEVTGIRKGPVITMFEILPAPGVKLSKIGALQDNIALRLAASSVRIVAPIPGKHAVGIEVPNKDRSIVSFKELIDTNNPAFQNYAIPVVLGKDITGEGQIIDLAKTPHLLIAGSTGSGKSVCVNTMILSILYKRSPQEVKMILIDPKIVELKLYNDIPHLLVPVITESKKAFQALQYCLCEMERRYALLDGMGVRDISNYNRRIKERNIAAEKLPYIVIIIDEFADLMATTGKELESTVARLAAMSRAVGIHLVLATQRPSIDVITGLIKANIPSRIAFMVASKMDSRIIIDQVGAEKLLGRGDMLYASATDPFPVRIQGTFVSDSEVENVVEYVKQFGEPEYIDDEMFVDEEEIDMGPNLFGDSDDPLYDQALEIVLQAGKASASYIQRRLKIGYNRAARLVEIMEEKGIVGPANGSKPREVIQMGF